MNIQEYTNELFQNKLKKYPRRKVLAYYVGDIFSADLVDMSRLKSFNKKYTFLLTIIDVYSRYAWAIPIKNKTGLSVLEAFKSIEQTPKNLFTDQGTEFFNSHMKKYCEEMNINLYHTYSEIGGGHIERFNRTLKEKMYKHLTLTQSNDYISNLPKIMKQYNETRHRIIKQKPIDVYFNGVIPAETANDKLNMEQKFKKGDYVRISKLNELFEKGYTRRWSPEVFQVAEVHLIPQPIMYSLIDLKGEEVTGKFYQEEMKPTEMIDFKVVDKTAPQKQRTINKKKEFLIKYDGYPDKFDEWVDEKTYKQLKKK